MTSLPHLLRRWSAIAAATLLVAACGGSDDSKRSAVALGDSPQRGPADAWVTIVEFSDFQCPFCKRIEPVVGDVLSKDPSDVRLVYKHLPLETLHPYALPAALASECAGEQQKFWEMHDRLFQDSPDLDDAHLQGAATALSLDLVRFNSCLQGEAPQSRIASDEAQASSLGVTGTPTFFVNGRRVDGANESVLRGTVDEELERARSSGMDRATYYEKVVLGP